jgi:hypothetical protein
LIEPHQNPPRLLGTLCSTDMGQFANDLAGISRALVRRAAPSQVKYFQASFSNPMVAHISTTTCSRVCSRVSTPPNTTPAIPCHYGSFKSVCTVRTPNREMMRLLVIPTVLIVSFTQLLGVILGRIRQPRVIAEVIGGVFLGPTVLGRIPGSFCSR